MTRTFKRFASAIALCLALTGGAVAAPLIPARASEAQQPSPFAYTAAMPQIFETPRSVKPAPKAAAQAPTRPMRKLRVMATAYALRGRTAGGTSTRMGTIAVDPRVIPLGTRMYVPGYGWGKALDTGGAIRGNVIDIWFPSNSQCFAWGVRTVHVLVEQPAPKVSRAGRPHANALLASRGGRKPAPRKPSPTEAARRAAESWAHSK